MPGPPLRGILSPPETSIWADPGVSHNLVHAGRRTDDVNDLVGQESAMEESRPAGTHVICKLARVVCSQVVSSTLDEEQVTRVRRLQILKCPNVGADVFADGSMRAAAWDPTVSATTRARGVVLTDPSRSPGFALRHLGPRYG
jgi:hypothetical protein